MAVLAVVGWLGVTFLSGSKAWQGMLVYQTAPAQRQTVMLPDGSRVTLGADSAVSVELRADERMLRLTRGEAYFQVAKDAKRPFIVRAGEARVRAVGTEFNVRLSAQRTVVAVAEGTVRVSAPSSVEQASRGSRMTGIDRGLEEPSILATAQLGAGQAVSYEGESGLQALPAGDASLAITWLDGRRKYRNEPLRYVLADVHRYTGRRIEVANAETGALKFTGTLSMEGSDAWFKALAIALPVTIVQEVDGKLLVTLKEPDAPQDDSDAATGIDSPRAYIDI
ncbi:MAG TPA: FecR domain-containing protein [Povalibacter sp.]|nr:FecR domain-containing protein [Povalibacter sp.]